MRMIDAEREQRVRVLQLYLTPKEAKLLRQRLEKLLANPEANKHAHILSEDNSGEVSFSIVTEKKLQNLKGYTELEQQILIET